MTRIEDVSLAVIVAWNLATYALVWMTFPQSAMVAGRYRRIAADRDRQRVLVVTTAGRGGAILAACRGPDSIPENGHVGVG
jgi:hypothetical protein